MKSGMAQFHPPWNIFPHVSINVSLFESSFFQQDSYYDQEQKLTQLENEIEQKKRFVREMWKNVGTAGIAKPDHLSDQDDPEDDDDGEEDDYDDSDDQMDDMEPAEFSPVAGTADDPVEEDEEETLDELETIDIPFGGPGTATLLRSTPPAPGL